MSNINTVAIIGGGVSGLTAGGLLALNGLKVKLFEANDKLGGCCANTNLQGYTFHDGALYLVLPGILDHVFDRLNLNRPSLLPLRKIVALQTTTLPDGTIVSFGEGLNVVVNKNKGEINTIQLQKELDFLMNKWEPVVRLFADEIIPHPFSFSRFIVKGWRHLHKLRGTVAAEMHKLFRDEAVRSAMAGILLYTGLPPDKSPVISLLGLVAMLSEGLYLPVGGMGKIPEVLSQSLTNNGGDIFLNAKVDNIVVKNGRIHGLKVEGHGLVKVDAVISTVSGMLTFSSLLNKEDIPDKMRKKVQNSPLSHKAILIQLGLSNTIDVRSHNNSILPLMEDQYKIFIPNDKEVEWPIYSVPTVTMPELAPPGGSIIEFFPPIKQDMPLEDWDNLKKEKIVETAIRTLSRLHALDIVVKRVLSPLDFQNSMHLYKGAVYGLSPTTDPRALFPHISPIPGLYQAGQTTYPGYGVAPAAMSGIFAAKAVMKTAHR